MVTRMLVFYSFLVVFEGFKKNVESYYLTGRSYVSRGWLTEMGNDNVKEWIRTVGDFRKGKNEFFSKSHESPLAHATTHGLKVLRYFPTDPKYIVHTILHKYDNPERVTMNTSKGTVSYTHLTLPTICSV